MADRLTQLQDIVNQQAENFCNSIGVLQQFASPSKFPGFSGSQTPSQNHQQDAEDYASLFASLVARCAKDIDVLIESLPADDSSNDSQLLSLRRLEVENQELAEKLELIVKRGEGLLVQVQKALADIVQCQLEMASNDPTVTLIN